MVHFAVSLMQIMSLSVIVSKYERFLELLPQKPFSEQCQFNGCSVYFTAIVSLADLNSMITTISTDSVIEDNAVVLQIVLLLLL